MKILLTAFACDPTRGSDAGVGWRWVEMLSGRGYDVWVMTRAAYRANIEAEMTTRVGVENLHFIYFDYEPAARLLYRVMRSLHVYYYLWQFGAYRLARRIHRQESFDCVHHVTWVSVRLPSFMGNLGIPFILGPIAGGESAPYRLRVGYGVRAWIMDGLRDVSNWFVKFDPFMRMTFAQASRIYVTSPQTLRLLPRACQPKARVQLAIASDDLVPVDIKGDPLGECSSVTSDTTRLLYVGRLLDLKGMHLGIRAVARMLAERPSVRLTCLGTGPAEARWRSLAERLGIAQHIDWIPWVPRSDVSRFYKAHDLFLFPSLHDSGGMVVLEAMAHGLPVVCLDIGGPGILVDSSCGISVGVTGRTQAEVVEALSAALVAATSGTMRGRLRQGALERVKRFTWRAIADEVYGPHE